MFFEFGRLGSIQDIGHGLRWDQESFAHEVQRRTTVLSQLGIRRGSIIAIAHAGTAIFFADLFSIWHMGATATCLDPSLTSAELQTIIDFVKPAAVLVDQALPAWQSSIPILQLATLRPTSDATPSVKICSDDDALILFTSGTTGAPKGVALSFRALQSRLELNAAAIGSAPLRRALVTLPTHFGHGLIGNALTPLTNGGDIVLCPRSVSLGDQLGRLIDEHEITFMSSVPSLWKIALESGEPASGNSLLRVHVGSAPLSARLWSEVVAWTRADVVNCYGMTEAANWIAGACSRSDGIAEGLVGRPWGGVAAVMNNRGTIAHKGDGEIVIQSPCLMRGYVKRPDLTDAVVSDGWLRTGDQGTIDEFGRIWLTGRIKDEINRAGFKVQPAELDLLLERHPDVAEACAFPVPNPITGEAVGVAIRPARTATIDLASLKSWCRERLRRGAVPEYWFIVQEIPRNARGKVNRAALHRALLGGPDGLAQRIETVPKYETRPVESPRGLETIADDDRIKHAVERAWTNVLDRRSFRADMPWSNAGGDSLGALSLLHDLERHLGRSIPTDILRMEMTPSYLIRSIAAMWSAAKSATSAQRDLQLPLIFFLPPAHGDFPALVEFRSALSTQIRFDVIEYPSLGEMIESGARFELMIDAAVRRIEAVCENNRCLMAGYSFGGLVAFEAARRLVGSGRQVDLLALIDTRLDRLPEKSTNRLAKIMAYLGKSWRRPDKLYRDGVWLLLSLIARHASPTLLRRIDHLTKVMPGSTAVALRIEIFTLLRAQAIRGWNFRPLSVPTILLRSNDAPASPTDLGWGTLCSQLRVQPVPGGHRSLFDPQHMAALCAQFAQIVQDAAKPRATIAPRRVSSARW